MLRFLSSFTLQARASDYGSRAGLVLRLAQRVAPESVQAWLRHRSARGVVLRSGMSLTLVCLHGFTQNGRQLAGQLAAIAARLPRDVELLHPDAPHACAPESVVRKALRS